MREDKRALRRYLTENPQTGRSDLICQNILAHPWFQEAKTVMAYMAFPPEPDLTPVLEEILRLGKGLVLPLCHGGGVMTARRVSDLAALRPGTWGILEPAQEAEIVEDIDLVLTPGMAFDSAGGRLGRGMGYYDRFLTDFQGKTMGVLFAGNLQKKIPMESHDRRMDALVTDREIILCEMEGDAF